MAACTVVGMGPGLGLAIARRFGRAGFAIGMIARKQETLAAAGEALGAEGIACAGVAADAASEASLRQALTELRTLQGDTQILVYNAFTDHRIVPTRLPLEDMITDFRVNVGGVLVAAQGVAPAMIRRANRAIVVTGGGYALHPAAGRSSLSLSKAALRSLVMSLAQELKACVSVRSRFLARSNQTPRLAPNRSHNSSSRSHRSRRASQTNASSAAKVGFFGGWRFPELALFGPRLRAVQCSLRGQSRLNSKAGQCPCDPLRTWGITSGPRGRRCLLRETKLVPG